MDRLREVSFTTGAPVGTDRMNPMCAQPKGASSMKRALIIAAGCALLAGPAWAQSPPSGPDRDGDRMDRRDMSWDRDRRGGWRRGDRDRDERPYRDDDPRGPGEGWHGGWSRDGGHRHGAGFWLRSGDTRLGVRCDPNEPMRACVEAATTLLDRMRSLPTLGAAATPPASSGAGAAASPPSGSGPGAVATPPAGSGAGAPAPRPTPR
jgi:hypothetical protein